MYKLKIFVKKLITSWIGLFIWTSLLYNIGWRHFYIPSASMSPTLAVGDIYIANMHTYGLNTPTLYGMKIFGEERQIFKIADPKSGDIVVFTNPETKDLYVKRVFAVSGDVVTIKSNNTFFRNGIEVNEPYAKINNGDQSQFNNQLKQFLKGDSFSMELSNNTKEFTYRVGYGEFFLLGDNRDNSFDSRFFGPIKSSSILGKASITLLSKKGIHKLN